MKLSDLIPDDRNANKGNPEGKRLLKQSLERYGAGRSILIDKAGRIIAGNKTAEQFEAIGNDVLVVQTDGTQLVAVQRTDLDLDSPEARALAVADNRVSEVSLEWDTETLQDLNQEGAIDLDDWFTPDEMAEWDEPDYDQSSDEEDEETADDLIEQAETGQIQPRCKLGEIWALGRHRIACGDSTDEKNVRALLGGKIIDLVFTDPPYGVSYADKNKSLNAIGRGNRIQTPIENDHASVDKCFKNIWGPCFQALFNYSKAGAAYYVCSPQGGELMMMMMALKNAGWLLKPQIIWVKNNHVLGRGDYQLKHEPILYGWKPGAAHYFTESRSEMSTWFFDKPLKSDLHPTMKPVELVQYAIVNSSRSGELVFDAFLGSGSTLIAAQKMEGNRTVYGFELSPDYCEVIMRRWEEYTGGTAQLAGYL